jgi:hypothetical protein
MPSEAGSLSLSTAHHPLPPPRSSFTAAHTGCLLEQLARHIIWGVEYSLELCTASSRLAGLAGFSLAFAQVNRQTSVQLAEQFINDRCGQRTSAGWILPAAAAHARPAYPAWRCAPAWHLLQCRGDPVAQAMSVPAVISTAALPSLPLHAPPPHAVSSCPSPR